MKVCKQCGIQQVEDNFRKYYSRGNGIRNSTQGRNTVCLKCEKLNATINRIYRAGAKNEREEALLTQAAEYYKHLVDKGLEPIGAYAGSVTGRATRQPSSTVGLDLMSLMQDEMNKDSDPLIMEYNGLLDMDISGMTPDDFEELVDTIERKTPHTADGKVSEIYRDAYMKLLDKQAVYEDNYKW